MERIDDIEQSFGVFNYDIVAANEHEFWMRHREFLAVRCANDQWDYLEATSHKGTQLSSLNCKTMNPEHYEVYYLHVIKEQPVRDVSRTLGRGR